MADVTILPMTEEDLEAMARLERRVFSKDAFLLEDLKADWRSPASRYLAAKKDGCMIGYAAGWIMLDEGYVTNLAVLEEYRGQGIGRQLMERLLQVFSNLGAEYARLHVRRSNLAAQRLYRALGFFRFRVEKGYYAGDGEDAFVLIRVPLPPPDPDYEE